MSEDYVHQITLEYLTNNPHYKNHLEHTKIKISNRKDKKFYRKRILNLTKDLLLFKETDNPILSDVKHNFEQYVKCCIEYFKTSDRSDIIQEDYDESGIETGLKELDEILESSSILENPNENDIFMRSIHIQPQLPTLDKFVIKTVVKKSNLPIIPQQKEINLKEPYLKNKGICKKKNITNNYEDPS